MAVKQTVFVCVVYLYVVSVKSIPPASNLSGVNKHITNGKAKAEIRNAAVFRNAKTTMSEYPEQIDVDLSIDGEGATRRMRAKKVVTQQSPLRVKDMNGKEFHSKHQGAALYATDDAVVGLIVDQNADGTSQTRVASRSKKNDRICYTNGEKSSCWTVDNSTDKEGDDVNQILGTRDMIDKIKSRRKRAQPIPTVDEYDTSLVVEIALVVDEAWMEIFRYRNGEDEDAAVEEASLYITMLMAEMTHIFRTVGEQSKKFDDIPDFELLIHGTMMVYPPRGLDFGFIVLDDEGVITWEGYGNTEYRYKRWVSRHYDTLLDRNFDHVAFITSRSFGYLLGKVTRLGGTCFYWSPVSVQGMISLNSDRNFDVLLILSHELLHSLGVSHERYTDCESGKFLMTAYWIVPTPETRFTRIRFSECSVRAIYDYIDQLRTIYGRDCLAGSANTAKWTSQFCTGGGRGEILDIDFQCKTTFGDMSFEACSPNIITVFGVKLVPARACWDNSRVVCGAPSANNCSQYDLYSVTDGTPCYKGFDTANRICHRGECRVKVDVCGSVDGLTTETMPVKELPCRCYKLKGIPKQQCCKNKRTEDNACCPGCEKRGRSCVVKTWRDNP